MTEDSVTRKGALVGAATALVAWFPAVAAVATVHRFPIPFTGYARGAGQATDALWAALVYGLAGVFVLVALGGGVGGWWVARRTVRSGAGAQRPAVAFAAVVGGAVAVVAALAASLLGFR